MKRIAVLAFLLCLGCWSEEQKTLKAEQKEPAEVRARERCDDFVQEVRVQHFRYFGLNFPFWYGVAQLEVESNCRSNATAFDAGQGIAQFMPGTAMYVCELMREDLDPYEVGDALKMQAFYMRHIHKQNWSGSLWLTYQAYNGGWGPLKSEFERAQKAEWVSMRVQCKRKVLVLKSGKTLDLCDVNYRYSKKVEKYGNKYRLGNDAMRFW